MIVQKSYEGDYEQRSAFAERVLDILEENDGRG